ncbi:cholecystokinin receptor-like [Lytechinus variegatus]|uniref:cholecystokinin receptor-like n=1 Tax=Lytechinus variegatus TaxID=7654 RepID=UPI001BB2256E|nr:cholecystokinin receptor-like [Lytechinus variegatus]
MAGTTNDTSPLQDDSQALSIDLSIATASQILFGILGVLGNALCFAVLRRQARDNNTNWLIVTQSAIDFITSLILIINTIQTTWYPFSPPHKGIGAELFCRVWNSRVATFSGFAISTFNLTIISLERYVAVVHPVLYMTRLKRRTIYLIAAAAWLTAPTLQIMFAVVLFDYDEASANDCIVVQTSAAFPIASGVATFLVEFFMPVVIMGYSFARITAKLRTFKRVRPAAGTNSDGPPPTCQSTTDEVPMQEAPGSQRLTTGGPQSSAPPGNNQNLDNPRPVAKSSAEEGRDLRRRNITITLLIVFVTYLVCWTPNQVTFFVYNVFGVPQNYLGSSLHLYTTILATFNICVNPFVYAFRYKAFKQGLSAALSRFTCIRCLHD